MNLMKYFNFNYMIQNLKKSKSILALFLGIIPILSIIVFLVLIGNSDFSSIFLESISFIHYFGIYFIPIMISTCLFGFIYKKKSVDFINSMPLSRKTIFTTNTITGIILLTLMVILSGLGIYVVSLFTSIIIPFRMIIDYILIWSITYIFVFILSNIAASISGNRITQIIVTMLLMLLIPFTVDYILSSNNFIHGSNTDICFEANNAIDEICYYTANIKSTNYTLPYNNIHNLFIKNSGLYNNISLIKMIIILIVGFIAGQILFTKRKMEINETTFRSLKTHNIVKALTMYPIVLIMVMLISNTNVSIFILICCLIFLTLYFFIYDLITKRNISEVGTSIIHLIIILIILVPVCIIIDNNPYSSNNVLYISHEEVDNYQIFNSDELSKFNYVKVTDKKSIEMITTALIERDDYKEDDSFISLNMIVTIDNIEYKIDALFKTERFAEIEKQIKSTNDIKNTKTLLDTNNNYALALEYDNIKVMTNDSKLIEEAKRIIKNNISCDNSSATIYLYNYNNGVISTYGIDNCTSPIISDYVDEIMQKENTKFFNDIKNLSYTEAIHKGYTYDINNYMENMYYDKEVYNFIKKHPSKNFTFSKDYISISFHIGNKKYSYHTNDVAEFKELFNKEK